MSAAEQQTNHALRILDGDLRSGRTTLDDYRRHRRHLLARLRESLDATLDITLRRPAPPITTVTAEIPTSRVAIGISVWALLLLLLAGGVWAFLSLTVDA